MVSGQVASEGLMLQRCRNCGSAFLGNPDRTGSSTELYDTGVYAHTGGGRDRVIEPARRLLGRERVRLLGTLPRGARVIEVGAGRGRLLAALRDRGHDAVGIEPSRTASAMALAGGLPVEAATLEEADFPVGKADLVVFWHVLEHLDRPREALAKARGWVKGGGRLVVAAPNLASLQARIGGDRWFHQEVPRHLTQFTVTGLKALLQRSGFQLTNCSHVLIEQNWLGMWLTMLNWMTIDRDVPFRFMKRDLRYRRRMDALRDALISILVGVPLLPAAALLEVGAGLARRGGTIVVGASPA
ncbi:MAG: class I SAM-dependent methyltransferase [Solirubrobacterales bacterium]